MNVFEGMRHALMVGLSRLKWAVPAGALLTASVTAHAVERELTISAPISVQADQHASVTIEASTDAVGEQVGFLQIEFSTDGGETWKAVSYLQNSGQRVVQPAQLKPGPSGSVIELRARAAFRDGLAGDVDFRGAAIMWQGNWKAWEAPPAKHVVIKVIAP